MDEAVRIEGLRKTYGDVVALAGIDIRVGRGEVFGLLGRNGAGKTTAIECALGLRRADAGRVRLLGLDPVADRRRLFERVGAQFQEVGYQDKIRVGELCAMSAALYARPEDWRALLSRFGLADKARKPVAELSGGQRQRLSIALALLMKPELVFLDEVTSGLDPVARREVWEGIESLKASGVAVFLSSHYMDEVERLCDRVAILRGGRIAAEGSPAELVARAGGGNMDEAYLRFVADAGSVEEEEAC